MAHDISILSGQDLSKYSITNDESFDLLVQLVYPDTVTASEINGE